MSWGRRLLVWGLVIGALGVSGFVCRRVADRGRFVTAYSSYGSGPKGARALFLLADRLGAAPVRWSQDFVQLPEPTDDDVGILVATIRRQAPALVAQTGHAG